MKHQGIYKGAEGKLAGYDITYTPYQKQPLVVFCHGFNGFKDWGAFNLIADFFLENKFNFAKLNFSHNGTSIDYPVDFVDLNAFGNNNFEKELFDIKALLEQLKKENFAEFLDFKNLFLIGHSKGGATALAYSLSQPEIISCATLAAVLNPINRYGKINDSKWKKEGVKYVHNGRTNQKMPLYYQLAENTQQIKEKLEIRNLLKLDNRKFLFIHGDNDTAVDVSETNLVKNLTNCSIAILKNANHVFGASHPYFNNVLPDDLDLALIKIVGFFKLQLKH